MSPRIVIVAVFAALAATGCGSSGGSGRLGGMVRTPEPTIEVPAGTVADDGSSVSFDAPQGGLDLVYFGYTSCPDICPTTLADLRAALKDLGDDATDKVHLDFVSVDPERDTEDVLDGYVHSFLSDASGVRISDRDALNRLGDAFGAQFGRTVAADGTVEVTHTAFLYALDSSDRLLVQWPFGTTRKELSSDLALLLDRQEQP